MLTEKVIKDSKKLAYPKLKFTFDVLGTWGRFFWAAFLVTLLGMCVSTTL